MNDPFENEPWEVISLCDGGNLFGTLTRTQLTLRLGDDIDGSISYSDTKELFDAEAMCRRIKDECGLMLSHDDWNRLIESAKVHH